MWATCALIFSFVFIRHLNPLLLTRHRCPQEEIFYAPPLLFTSDALRARFFREKVLRHPPLNSQ
ncbi:hypothetical protein Plhal304r1_c043g0122881 [Plasmopara halstedii]